MINGFVNTLNTQKINFQKGDLQVGFLVYQEEEQQIYFRDAQEKYHELKKVYFSVNEWNLADGNKNLPKPYVIDSAGNVKEFGSNLLYTFVNSTEANIVVFGQLMNVNYDNPDEKLDCNPVNWSEKHLARNNVKRYFSVTEDGKGNLIILLKGKDKNGNFVLKVDGESNQQHGNVKIELNGKFFLNQVTDSGEINSQIYFDNTSGNERIKVIDKHKNVIELNKKGTVIQAETIDITGKGTTNGLNLKKLIVRLINVVIAMRQPTNNGATQGPPTNMSDFVTLRQDVEKLLKENE